MGLSVRKVLEQQMILSGAKPLCAPAALNSLGQLKVRMAQEAINNGSEDTIGLNHFIGSLIGHPNGPVRFHLMEAMRSAHTSEQIIRDKLGLSDYDYRIEASPIMRIDSEVREIFSIAENLAQSRKEDLRVSDLLTACVVFLSPEVNINGFGMSDLAQILINKLTI